MEQVIMDSDNILVMYDDGYYIFRDKRIFKYSKYKSKYFLFSKVRRLGYESDLDKLIALIGIREKL